MRRDPRPVTAAAAVAAARVLATTAPPAAAQHTIPIHVEVDLGGIPTGHWLPSDRQAVLDTLSGELERRLADTHRNWTFSGDADAPVVIALETEELATDEVVARLELRLRQGPPDAATWQATPVWEEVLYTPGHFDTFGLPQPADARDTTWQVASEQLGRFRQSTRELLEEKVPLARGTADIDPAESAVVAPLPKERFEHLAWSRFRLVCRDPPTLVLESEAKNEWAAYGDDIPAALKLYITNDLSDPAAVTPVLVYLEDEVENPSWTFFDDDDGGGS